MISSEQPSRAIAAPLKAAARKLPKVGGAGTCGERRLSLERGPRSHENSKANAFRLLAACFALSLFSGCSEPEGTQASTIAATRWQPLFDGETLDGWHPQDDGALFYAEDGLLVGEVTQDGGYLVTDRDYADFIMEADVKVDSGINSGFQARGRELEEDITVSFLNGRLQRQERTWKSGDVTGYQIEVDPTDRAWSGGLYEPRGRGWLQPVTDNQAAKDAFKIGEWNTFRIEMRGDVIKSWVNGVPVADTTDSVNKTGFIGLQTHSAHSDEEVGAKIYFRNLRIQPL